MTKHKRTLSCTITSMRLNPEHAIVVLADARQAPHSQTDNLHLHSLSVNASNPLHTINDLQMSEEQDSDQETQVDGRDEGNGSISGAPGAATESPDLHNNEPMNISLHHTRSLRGDLRLSPTNYGRIVKARSSYNVQLVDTDRAANDNGDDDGLEYDEFLVMSTAERDVRAAFRRAACAAEGRYHDEKSTSTVIVLGL